MKTLMLALVAAAALASLPIAGAQARTRPCGVITTTNHAGGSARWVVTVDSGAVSCTTARRVLSEGLSLSGGGNPEGWRCGPPAAGAGLRCSRGSSVILAAPARSAGMCGFNLVDGTYLTSISGRRNVSCAEAKRVVERDKKLSYCTPRQSSQGWTIRHRGSKYELQVRFTKGNEAFDVMSEGSCH